MATVATFNQENKDKDQENLGGGGEILTTGSSGGGGESSGGPTSQSGPNISQYLAANQGAGQQLASGITSDIQNKANQLGQNVEKSQGTLNQQYQGLNEQLGEKGQQNIQTAFQNPQDLLDAYNASKTQTSSTPLSSDQQKAFNAYNEFQKLNSGGYGQDISQYGAAGQAALGGLQNQYQNLAQQTGSAANEMGRFQLLRQAIGQPNYSQGQQSLDSLFLQAQPGVANQLKQNLGQIGAQAQQQVKGFGSDTQAKLAALQGLSGQNQQLIQNMFSGGMGDISQNVQNEYQQAQTEGPEKYKALQQAFQTNTFTPEQLADLGVTSGMRTWGLTPQQLMSAGAFHQNPLLAAEQGGYAQVASPEEFARYNALNQLAGGGPGQQLQESVFGGATEAGGYDPTSFNSQAFQNAINARRDTLLGADFQNALQNTYGSLMSNHPGRFQTDLIAELKQAKTPQEAEAAVQKYIGIQHYYGINDVWGAYSNLSPFQNYYNQQFLPAALGQLGQTTGTTPGYTTGAQYSWVSTPSGWQPSWNQYTGAAPTAEQQALINSALASSQDQQVGTTF